MGSLRRTSLGLAGYVLGAWVLHAAALGSPAAAAAPDAGVERASALPAQSPRPPEAPLLKSIGNPAQLSESVRARLERRPAERPPLAAREPRRYNDEPLRRGQARLRRVQALETVEGVTLLSNRLEPLPASRLSALAVSAPVGASAPRDVPDEPDEAPEDEPRAALVGERESVTETRSLRTYAARPAPGRTASSEVGWLLWPFAVFVAGGAVVGALWFRKKTS